MSKAVGWGVATLVAVAATIVLGMTVGTSRDSADSAAASDSTATETAAERVHVDVAGIRFVLPAGLTPEPGWTGDGSSSVFLADDRDTSPDADRERFRMVVAVDGTVAPDDPADLGDALADVIALIAASPHTSEVADAAYVGVLPGWQVDMTTTSTTTGTPVRMVDWYVPVGDRLVRLRLAGPVDVVTDELVTDTWDSVTPLP